MGSHLVSVTISPSVSDSRERNVEDTVMRELVPRHGGASNL
jgi:hypothetical protein